MSSYPTDKIEEVEELLTVSSILSMTLKLRDIVLSNFEAIYNQSIEENLEDYNIICWNLRTSINEKYKIKIISLWGGILKIKLSFNLFNF